MSIGENGMKMILRGEFERKLLESLKALTLIGSDVFRCKILEQFPNIEKLVVCDGSFKKMFCCESGNNVLQQLKVLRLESLGELVSIGLENSWNDSLIRNIETFEVISCWSLKNLVASTVSFSNLSCLKVERCGSLSYLLTSSTAKRLDKLKIMEIKNCDSINEIVCQEDESVGDEIIFPQLTCLNLLYLRKLKMFYRGSLGFPSLEELSIKGCKKMITLCVGTVVTGKLSQVNLELDEYSEAIEWEIDPNSTKMKKYLIETQRESRIDLSSRGGLHEIWRGSLSIPNFCFSELVTLIVYDCPFLSDAVLPFHLLPLIPKLETLEVRNCDFVKIIFDVKDPPHGILCMQHLKKVKVKVCKSLRSVFPASVAKDLELEDLVVEECERLVGIVADDNTDPNLQLTLPCPYLRSLKLWKLQKFTYFYYCSHKSDIYTHLESPTEDQLPNEKCMSVGENGMKMILRGEFEKKLLDSLKVLTLCFDSDVFGCKILEQVPNIEKLEVCDGSFKKMFCCESPNNVLQQLKVLRLKSLGELVSIGLDNSWTHSFVGNIETFEVIKCLSLKNLIACTVSFSNLTSLKVEHCNSLSYLLTSSTAKSLGQLKRMEIRYCSSIEEIVCKEDGKESDEDEIIFPQLTSLNLLLLPQLKRFYKGSLGFPSLEELSVTFCNKMISLCVGSIVGGKMCEVKVGEFSEAIQLETELNSTMRKEYLRQKPSSYWEKRLELRDRADLQEIWCLSLQIPDFCFTHLETLIVNKCKISSDAVLPFTLLPLLPKLETFEVQNCDSVKSIFDVKCGQETLTFPLKKLVLRKLSNLETICNEVTEANSALPKETNRMLTFPCVTSLALCDLPNFIYDEAAPTFELIIPHLEYLTVGKKELKKIVDGEFQRNLLHKLKVLGLCFDTECDEFPEYGFLHQLPNVKKLGVWSSSFKVIFYHQRPNNNELLLQLNELRLESLGELVSIGLENSWTESFVRNLETFEVIRCSSLENLVTCTVSFSNLTCLKVENCDGLSYLFTFSTAKSLGQLQRMEIKECKSIEEIVSKEREESDEDEIIFLQLSCLKLDKLLNLRWFYRGNLSFPSLKELSVIYCDEMVTFCPSTLKADKLSQVTKSSRATIGGETVIPLKTDLNLLMQKEFGRETQRKSRIDLKSRPGLYEIWRGSLSIPNFCFSNLDTLIVDDCQFLSDAVLPFHLLPLLPKLETLEVRHCDSVKTVFDVNPSTQDTSITFPLKKLVLSKLPNLENIWKEDPRGILSMHHHIEQVFVDTCKCLKSVFPASVAKELVKLEDLVVEDCERLMAIVADESHMNQEIIFERLQVLDLKRLKQLTCFCAANFTLSFPSLVEVHVINCSSMKSFSAVTKIDNPTKWYYSEYERPRKETDLNSALHRNFEEEVLILKLLRLNYC
ncbi:hypothetical protein V8G54_009356 [Vigna mungo]|uniref:Disease resistance protein At4g27190-like leucine-rich repeats domain-containing protein n=1 Tax=Vigna mungo TaxID=3915 RepID=A0AAQ3S217_VIGMU